MTAEKGTQFYATCMLKISKNKLKLNCMESFEKLDKSPKMATFRSFLDQFWLSFSNPSHAILMPLPTQEQF